MYIDGSVQERLELRLSSIWKRKTQLTMCIFPGMYPVSVDIKVSFPGSMVGIIDVGHPSGAILDSDWC